jgi:hypothetical protein
MPKKRISAAKRLGFRSGLEKEVYKQIEVKGFTPEYEKFKISYIVPSSNHTYLPDFRLPNGIIIETKGRFVLEDRKKHLLIREQYPNLDIRFVFTNSKAKINKGSKTTYSDWCDKNGFKYADKLIPKDWFAE